MKCVVGVVLGLSLAQIAWADCTSDVIASLNAECNNPENVNNDEVCKMGKILKSLQDANLYGKSNTDYVRVFSICDPNTNNGQPCPDVDQKAATHDVVTFTVATDASYLIEKGQAVLDAHKGRYQCIKDAVINVVGVKNVIETAPVDLAVPPPPPPQNNNPPPNAPPAAVACHSKDFACDKQVVLQLPIGKYCNTSTFDLSKQERLLWMEGTDAMFILDSLTQKAVLCKNKKSETCGNGGFFAIGKNEDGSSQGIAFEGSGGKGNFLGKAASATFLKLLATKGKGLIEAVTAQVLEDCDAVMTLMQDDFKQASELPDTEKISFNGKEELVKDDRVVLLGNKAILLVKNKVNSSMLGVNTISLKENSGPAVFKPFPQAVLDANYTSADDVAVLTSDDKHAELGMTLQHKDNLQGGADYIVCDLVFDAVTPLSCDPQKKVIGGGAASDAAMAYAKFGQIARDSLGNEKFGKLFVDQMLAKNLPEDNKGSPQVLMHKIEGYGDRPNAIVVTTNGAFVYRLGADSKVSSDKEDTLPGVREYILADLDNFAGKDLIGFSDTAVILLPKINLPPKIEQLVLKPAADNLKLQGQVVTKTQEDEKLDLKWQLFEFRDGKLTERADLISDVNSEQPILSFPVDSIATNVTELPAEFLNAGAQVEANVGVNAKMAKSVGAKASEASSLPVYYVALTATDPGGLSATSYASISKSVGAGTTATSPVGTPVSGLPGSTAPGTSLGSGIAHEWDVMGGCSLIR